MEARSHVPGAAPEAVRAQTPIGDPDEDGWDNDEDDDEDAPDDDEDDEEPMQVRRRP